MSEPQNPPKKRHRSPSYPAISLREAVDKARLVWDKESRHPVNHLVLVKHWGYAEKSSGGLVAMSALIKFGLMEDVEAKVGRELKLTDLALRIVAGEETERKSALKQAALRPKIYGELWKKYGVDLPSDDSLTSRLILQYDFNRTIVQGFIKDYKDTIKFAEIGSGDIAPDDKGEEPNGEVENDDSKGKSGVVEPPPYVPPHKDKLGENVLATYKIPLGSNEAELIFRGERRSLGL